MAARQPMLSFAKVVKGGSGEEVQAAESKVAPTKVEEEKLVGTSEPMQDEIVVVDKKRERKERHENRERGDRYDRHDKFHRKRQSRNYRDRENRDKFDKKPAKQHSQPEPQAEPAEKVEEPVPEPEPVVLEPAPLPAVNAWFKKGQGMFFLI